MFNGGEPRINCADALHHALIVLIMGILLMEFILCHDLDTEIFGLCQLTASLFTGNKEIGFLADTGRRPAAKVFNQRFDAIPVKFFERPSHND